MTIQGLKDKIEIYRKNNRNISPKNLMILCLICLLILLGVPVYRLHFQTFDTKYISPKNEAETQITFLGDMKMAGSVAEIGNRSGYESLFNNVKHIWDDSDLVIGTLDNAVLLENDANFRSINRLLHRGAPPSAVNAVKAAGVDVVSLANNGVAEFEAAGVESTLQAVREAGLDSVGAGKNIEDAEQFIIKDLNGIKTAILGISDIIPKVGSAQSDTAGILSTSYDNFNNLIFEASQEADLVVVIVHWGQAGALASVSARQRHLAQSFIDAGANIIVGGNPQVLQPIEKYNDGIIFYSLGNLISDEGASRWKESIVINYIINEGGEGYLEILFLRRQEAVPHIANNSFSTRRTINHLTKYLDLDEYEIRDEKLIINGSVINIIREEELLSDESELLNDESELLNQVTTYIVEVGDTLSEIADTFGITLYQIQSWNKLESRDHINVGQVLNIVEPPPDYSGFEDEVIE